MTKKRPRTPAPAPSTPVLEPEVVEEAPPPAPKGALIRAPAGAGSGALSTDVAEIDADARAFIDASVSKATKRGYSADWRTFEAWCRTKNVRALPAEVSTMINYLTHLAKSGKKVATIERARTAISQAHETAHAQNPMHVSEVKRVMKGIRRTTLVAKNKKTPLFSEDIRAMVMQAKKTPGLKGVRDAALLALGFAGAFRRSELVAINVEHLRFQTEGLAVYVAKSKTDQEGKGAWAGIQHPGTVALVQAWLKESGIEEGPVFRRVFRLAGRGGFVIADHALSPEAVADIVKSYALALGLDPKKFAGHSLRRGFASQGIKDGKSQRDVMKQTRHKSAAVFEGYVEEASLFQNNASKDLW